ncbi:hypothetical protein P4E94_13155 [Pontiellaceae bacterium B12219]|nr:hypothetical protein [Pontiellaceae bacterium B12219]
MKIGNRQACPLTPSIFGYQAILLINNMLGKQNMNENTPISESALIQYSQLIDEGTLAYFTWIKQILTLSVGSLTILIGLRNQIAPGIPQASIILQISWFLFAASIVLSLFALQGQHILLFHTAQDCLNAVKSGMDKGAGSVSIPNKYRICGQITPWVFVSAIVSLTLFGILNLTPVPNTKPEDLPKHSASLEKITTTLTEHPQTTTCANIPNQQVDPIVTTPVDKVEPQSTQDHP